MEAAGLAPPSDAVVDDQMPAVNRDLEPVAAGDTDAVAGGLRGTGAVQVRIPGDESFYVVEGSVDIDLVATGERVELKAGDIASFPKGTRSVWTFSEPFKKFTVISN
jgi:uncharacterized cupin superfamily protein